MSDPDFDFRHSLHDTIVLLGGDPEIAALLDKSKDGAITETDVDRLRQYNIDLITKVKTSLNNVHEMTIRVQPPHERIDGQDTGSESPTAA